MRYGKSALGGLVLTLGMLVGVQAQTVVSPAKADKKEPPTTLKAGLVTGTKEKAETVDKLLKALGPAISEQLRAGRTVEIPGLGTFRVVRVDEYKDLVDGRPATIPAKNYVEFVPGGTLDKDANAPGAKPARTVQGYDFRINPHADAGIKTGSSRNIGTRTK